MNMFGRMGMGMLVLALTACVDNAIEQEKTPPMDEATYKATFSKNFNDRCYAGYSTVLKNQNPSVTQTSLQVAQETCACISYNLVQSNNIQQLEALSQLPDEKVLELTRPLVKSCSTQVQAKFEKLASQASAVEIGTPK